MNTADKILYYRDKGFRFFAERRGNTYYATAKKGLFKHTVVKFDSSLEEVFEELLNYLDISFEDKNYQGAYNKI